MSELTDKRGAVYGKPAEHHGKVAVIWNVLTDGMVPRTAVHVQVLWIIDKLVRFVHSGFLHADSIRDIAGYAECVEETWGDRYGERCDDCSDYCETDCPCPEVISDNERGERENLGMQRAKGEM